MPIALTAAAAAIVATVTGVPSAQGRVHVDICPEAHWLKPDCPWHGEAPAREGTVTVAIPGVPPGRYAAQAFHDANGNGRTDRNFLGLPTERIGFSHDALKGLSRPRFADAAIEHGDAEQAIGFQLRRVP